MSSKSEVPIPSFNLFISTLTKGRLGIYLSYRMGDLESHYEYNRLSVLQILKDLLSIQDEERKKKLRWKLLKGADSFEMMAKLMSWMQGVLDSFGKQYRRDSVDNEIISLTELEDRYSRLADLLHFEIDWDSKKSIKNVIKEVESLGID